MLVRIFLLQAVAIAKSSAKEFVHTTNPNVPYNEYNAITKADKAENSRLNHIIVKQTGVSYAPALRWLTALTEIFSANV